MLLDLGRLAGVIGCAQDPTGTERRPVRLAEAWTEDGVTLQVNVPVPGAGGDGCLDSVTVPLDEPIGDRTVTDVVTGDVVALEDRRR